MNFTVIGPGRWGSFIAWYLCHCNYEVNLYGREGSKSLKAIEQEENKFKITSDLEFALSSDIIVISVNSQGFRALMSDVKKYNPKNKTFVLCMKGIEIGSNKRLSQIAKEYLDKSCKVAVWIGPGHVQEFKAGIPNCMVIDSECDETKRELVKMLSSDLIRFYYGSDLIGNEIGAAAKNVIGIAAGMLDGIGVGSLKGALMSRGTREIARLIKTMGGNENSAYGLCHLGDYQATVFSEYSHNRMYGEKFVKNENYGELAEGYYTVKALMEISSKYNVELPICEMVYKVIYENYDTGNSLKELFSRSIKEEFYE